MEALPDGEVVELPEVLPDALTDGLGDRLVLDEPVLMIDEAGTPGATELVLGSNDGGGGIVGGLPVGDGPAGAARPAVEESHCCTVIVVAKLVVLNAVLTQPLM